MRFTRESVRSRSQVFLLAAIILLLLPAVATTALAGSATWKASPVSNDWNTATNWTPQTVPNGVNDTATFAASNITALSFSYSPTIIAGIVFNAGASAFTISKPYSYILTIFGTGITNNSGQTQNFLIAAQGNMTFTDTASAGTSTNFNNHCIIQFLSHSTTGSAIFTNNSDSYISFNGSATAGNATFTNNAGSFSGAHGGLIEFLGDSTAGNSTITNNGGTFAGALVATTRFDNALGGNSTLIANGGVNGGGRSNRVC